MHQKLARLRFYFIFIIFFVFVCSESGYIERSMIVTCFGEREREREKETERETETERERERERE